eukprot:4868621-Amphidinium_carterae.1
MEQLLKGPASTDAGRVHRAKDHQRGGSSGPCSSHRFVHGGSTRTRRDLGILPRPPNSTCPIAPEKHKRPDSDRTEVHLACHILLTHRIYFK